MILSRYLERKKLSPSAFAETIGVKRQTVHRYLNGERTPWPDVMARITAATGGAVTANDFMPVSTSARVAGARA